MSSGIKTQSQQNILLDHTIESTSDIFHLHHHHHNLTINKHNITEKEETDINPKKRLKQSYEIPIEGNVNNNNTNNNNEQQLDIKKSITTTTTTTTTTNNNNLAASTNSFQFTPNILSSSQNFFISCDYESNGFNNFKSKVDENDVEVYCSDLAKDEMMPFLENEICINNTCINNNSNNNVNNNIINNNNIIITTTN